MKNYITLPDGRRKTCKIYDQEFDPIGQVDPSTGKIVRTKVADRYTAVYRAIRHERHGLYWPYLGMNAAPFDPQGIGQHGELSIRAGRYLGKRIAFEQLPEDCQKAIIQDLT